jgi:hypothetical protein
MTLTLERLAVDTERASALTGDQEQLSSKQPDDADAFERRARQEANAQFARLKDEARTLYGLVHGRPGVRSAKEWRALLEKAGDALGTGHFLVRQLGAERYLDPEMVAVLITLRQNLLAELAKPTAADIMIIDGAVLAYYNMLRTQHWIGDLSLVVERELFGQEPLNQIHGPMVGARLSEEIRRLAEVCCRCRIELRR